MKRIFKNFPLTVYSAVVAVLVLLFILIADEQRDELSLIDPVFWVFILNLPLVFLGKLYALLGIKYSLPRVIFLCLLLDIFLLRIRTKFFPKLKSKFTKKL